MNSKIGAAVNSAVKELTFKKLTIIERAEAAYSYCFDDDGEQIAPDELVNFILDILQTAKSL